MTDALHPLCAPAERDQSDGVLATRAAGGDRRALEELLQRHQRWVYAIALRMVRDPSEASDIAQEALLKMVTRIAQFEGKSSFGTWAYRIVVRCFLDAKRTRSEETFVSFDVFGVELDRLPLQDLELDPQLEPDRALIVEEAKIGCMLGMLLCLDREQRISYILGAIFGVPSEVAAEVLEITPPAFRKRLERARADLSSFMNDKCGLVNEANPCRCPKKTAALIREGWVNPRQLRFVDRRLQLASDRASGLSQQLEEIVRSTNDDHFRSHPTTVWPDLSSALTTLFDGTHAAK